ncbi:MAG: Xaa-Pro dipeptidase [bacterium]|nr:Xaa-Pro dipeptidase [bacterium]
MSHGEHYRDHLQILDRYLTEAIEHAGRQGLKMDGVLFHSGRLATYHRDDELIVFRPTPHFRRWVPLDGPEHAVLARPGRTPLVVRLRPTDYWYDSSPQPVSYWEEAVELVEVGTFDELLGVTGSLDHIAYAGSSPAAAAQAGIPEELVEPEALMAPLDWYRAYKTEHEVGALRVAAKSVAAGHLRAREVFEAGGSEREAHWAYLEAADLLEHELPYGSIVAYDHKAAILHYQHKRGAEAAPGKTFLLDAGGAHEGYAIDVTRTWAREDAHPAFGQLIEGVDAMERELVAMVTSGRPYLEIHVETHRGTARLLAETGVVKIGAEEAFDRGITRTFLPHGVGHQLGLQVHDVGGHQAGPGGGTVAPPADYPFLRNTRILEPGQVVTIEPGIYFTPTLLDPLRAGDDADAVDWDLVDQLIPLGGVRIEDNIVCRDGEPEDLTRHLIPGP